MQKLKIPPEKKNIVILGGGFAGVRAALDLNNYLHDDQEYEIILVDRRDYQTYYSALYEAATTEHGMVEAKKVKRTVAIPFAEIFQKTKVKVFKGYVERISLQEGKVVTDSRIIPFDYLMIGMGSVSDFYGIPNLDKYSFTLKSLEDAIMIRNRVEDLVTKKDQGRIIIGGGGFAGAEFAGELHNLIKHECQHHQKDPNNFKILIVEGGTSFISGLSEKVSAIVGTRLTAMGVESRFSTLITEAGKDYVMLNNKERVENDLLIWTGGVRSCRLPVDVELGRDKKDRTDIESYLNLKNYPQVFLAGDNACVHDPKTKKPVAQTAQEAIHQGSYVARNIYRLIKDKPLMAYQPGPVRFVIPVTGKFAVMYSPNLIVSGFAGWLIRKAADFRYFFTILPLATAIRYWIFENRIFMKND
ncbi:MAG: FAD-dependent oxidoreductase [Candidatus Doudnabacteria bacterium]|nr:FAD-dependent oxidoreductase [Candidatus Doudnabacteria bacterium]